MAVSFESDAKFNAYVGAFGAVAGTALAFVATEMNKDIVVVWSVLGVAVFSLTAVLESVKGIYLNITSSKRE